MALLSRRLAIMSVGVSCQAAHQLRTHAGRLGQQAGEAFEVHTTPWDWTICAPAGVAAMLDDGRTFPAVEELEDRLGKPYWPGRGCFFWHMKGAITDHAAAADQAQRQRAHLDAVAAAKRRVFILANTQNNVARVTKPRGGFNVFLAREPVDRLQAALTRRFGQCELWVITRPKLHGLGRDRPRVIELETDRSSWEGDTGQWRAALERIAGPP